MLREAVRAKTRRRGETVLQPMPWLAPVKGWRTDQPLQAMEPDAAASLVNFFPEAGYIRARGGSQQWATGLGTTVNTLIPYTGSTNKLFAAAGSNIYDVTSSGAVGAAAVSGLTSDHWSYAQISTAGGFYLTICNGADSVRQFNGSAWSTPGFTGVTLSKLSVVHPHRERLYFIQNGTTSLWYGTTFGVSGALTQLDCGADMQYGGYLVALGTWTLVSVYGLTLLLVVITSNGELLFYSGSNPSDSTNWSLIGNAKLSPPLGGDRCARQVGADLAIMTEGGIVPASKALTLDPSAVDLVSLTRNIAPTFLQIVQGVGTSGPWQFLTHPMRRMAIVNVPDTSAGYYQLVMNTETHAWTKFIGMSTATCWESWNDGLYFGDGGVVYKAEVGGTDNGAPIDCQMTGAWNSGDGVSRRMPSMIAINAQNDGSSTFYGAVSTDFTVTTPVAVASASGGAGAATPATWGSAQWDVSYWPGTANVRLLAAAAAPSDGASLAPSVRAIVSGNSTTLPTCNVYGGSVLFEPGEFI